MTRALVVLAAALPAALPWMEGGASASGVFVFHSAALGLAAAAWIAGRREPAPALAGGYELALGLAFLGACGLSFAAVDYRFGSLMSVLDLGAAALLALCAMRLGPGLKEAAILSVAVTGVLQAIAVFVTAPAPNMTASGSFANANQAAIFLDVAILAAACRAADLAGRRAWAPAGLWAGAALLPLAAVVFTGSRGALLALVAAGSAGVLTGAARARGAVRAALWGLIGLVLAAGIISVAARFARIADPYRYERIGIWRAGLQAAADHPVLGLGPGMFERRAFAYNFPLEGEMFRYAKTLRTAHSSYVQALAETGLLGAAALGLFVIALSRRCVMLLAQVREGSRPVSDAGPPLAMIACLAHAAVETPFSVPAVTASLIVLLAPMAARGPGAAELLLPLGRVGGAPRPLGIALCLGLAATLWAGCVALPFAAHLCFGEGVKASRPGRVDARIDRAVTLNPINPLYPATRAQIAWRRDEPLSLPVLAAADLDLEEAARLDPGNPEHLLRRAQLHARACFDLAAQAASLARAERYYRAAIGLKLKDPRPRFELGTFLLAQGRQPEGIAELAEALELEPRYLGAWLARARALAESGRTGEAAEALARLESARRELAGHAPRNGYEADLMKLDDEALSTTRRMIGPPG